MRRLQILGVALGLGACDDARPPPRPSVLDAGTPPSFTAARRPRHTIYLEREADRCAVYWQADGTQSVKKTVLCPRHLEEGERLRLTGRTCHRESEIAAREVPVRCSQPLFQVERALEDGGGEYHLPPALVDPDTK